MTVTPHPQPADRTPAGQAELRELLSAACDRKLSGEEQSRIEALLASDERLVIEYVEYVTTESCLEQHCGVSFLDPANNYEEPQPAHEAAQPFSAPSLKKDGERPRPHARPSKTSVDRKFFAWPQLLALAAGLLLAIGTATVWLGGNYGSVVAVHDAEWKSSGANLGDSVGSEWRELEVGSVDFALNRGAMVSVSGPARFRFVGPNRCELTRGSLSARVVQAARGFRVDSPLASAIDLGTGFRYTVEPDGRATIHVSEGVVKLQRQDSRDGAIQISAGEIGVSDADGIAKPSLKPPRTTLAMRYEPVHPASLGYKAYSYDNRLSVFLESYRLRLPYNVPLNVTSTGSHSTLNDVEGLADKGAWVDCYLIHSSPLKKRHLTKGTVTFANPIIGVICDGDRLTATNTLLGSRWSLRCEHPERGLESSPDPNSDVVTISRDRRTLSVAVRTESIDQLRVLVEAE